MPIPRLLLLGLFLALPLGPLFGQSSPAAANLLSTGNFEGSMRTVDNLWDGVDSDGNLAVPTYSASVLTEGSALGKMAMPPSVAVADLNGDGKLDLLVASPTGYYYYYQNFGTPTEPRFTSAEVLPLFMSTSSFRRDNVHSDHLDRIYDRYCPRISLADWRKRGVLDLMIGNFFGELLFVPNSGTTRAPVFAQPQTIEGARIPTSVEGHYWANLLDPVAADWNGDGRLDVITGEGTYSANAIHLLENTGSEIPKFTDAGHTRIAFGDGREHLIPTVADCNGDGFPDLLVADRSGEIGIYLNPGMPKPGVELKRSSTISFGGSSKLPGLVSPTAADLNGDGLFDLVLGMPNGRIAVAYNTGTKTQPAFGAWRELKGEDRLKRTVRVPTDWEMRTTNEFGNAFAYWQVVGTAEDKDSAPPEGANCMKAGYWPIPTGGLFPMPDSNIPQSTAHFYLIHPLTLQTNRNYKISFKAKGSGIEKAKFTFQHLEEGYSGEVKVTRGDRGEAQRTGPRVAENVVFATEFSPGSNWGSYEKTINIRLKNAALQDRTEVAGDFFIEFNAQNRSSTLYVDDIQVIPQG